MKNSELKRYIKNHLRKNITEAMLNENLPLCCWDSAQNTTQSGCCFQETGMCICHETETGGQFGEYCCDDESNMVVGYDRGTKNSVGKGIKRRDTRMQKESHISIVNPGLGHDTTIQECLTAATWTHTQAKNGLDLELWQCTGNCGNPGSWNPNHASCVADCNSTYTTAVTQIGMELQADETECHNRYNTNTPTDTTGGTSGGTGQGVSCFIAGTKVKMADGTDKNIEDVEIGEEILGQGGINTVMEYDRPKLGERKLYSFNGGKAFVTAEHPFMTEGGWKSIDPKETLKENPDLTVDILNVGDVIITNSESVTIESIEAHEGNEEDTVYNFILNGDHTYYADEYLVHNKENVMPGGFIPPEPEVDRVRGHGTGGPGKGRGRRLDIREAAKNVLNEMQCPCYTADTGPGGSSGGVPVVNTCYGQSGNAVVPHTAAYCCGGWMHPDDVCADSCLDSNNPCFGVTPGGNTPIGIEPDRTRSGNVRQNGIENAAINMLEDEEFLLNEFFACDCGLYGGSGTEICLNTQGGCSTCCANQMVAPTKGPSIKGYDYAQSMHTGYRVDNGRIDYACPCEDPVCCPPEKPTR